ncbi:hypothetical protein ABG79_00114 [Caloramator mitchellensis]|uniref:Uncharacterized protein n=1 Tax=Caloramator mitchellensis TaxID=908809 RepID=A0A0R3K093_CALMK|nr:hypothetical protein [Caloramator mitchellensis]KRQ87949.1 hypothetical protein ABG79_00114 [Caloramator mitchellensis]
MLRLWGKIIKNNRLIKHDEVTIAENIEYQEQLKKCITELCYRLDIQKPYWLPHNLDEYNNIRKTSFNQDNFIEEIDFDKFEIIELES